MNDCECKNKTQCWEPCGELGKSAEHAVVSKDIDFFGLLPCPFCGGEVRWCGEDPKEPHGCDQISCPTCEINIDCHSDSVSNAGDFEMAKPAMAQVWNRRAR